MAHLPILTWLQDSHDGSFNDDAFNEVLGSSPTSPHQAMFGQSPGGSSSSSNGSDSYKPSPVNSSPASPWWVADYKGGLPIKQESSMSDDELVKLSVKELNQRMQGCDKVVVSSMKQKRRTLKNRGYALNCRIKRLQLQLQLEAENQALKMENQRLRRELTLMNKRLLGGHYDCESEAFEGQRHMPIQGTSYSTAGYNVNNTLLQYH